MTERTGSVVTSNERAGEMLFELCKRDGASPHSIRVKAPFMESLAVTQICLQSRYSGDGRLWAEAAYEVLDCVTSSADDRVFGRRASRFMRACLGLDAELGGLEARMLALANSPYEFPRSTTTLRAERRSAMEKLSRYLIRLTEYPCMQADGQYSDEATRAFRLLGNFARFFTMALRSDASQERANALIDSFEEELPKLGTLFTNPRQTFEDKRRAWNALVTFFAKEVYIDVAAQISEWGYSLRPYDSVMWMFRMERKRGPRVAIEPFNRDLSTLVFTAILIVVDTHWFEEIVIEIDEWLSSTKSSGVIRRIDLAEQVEMLVRGMSGNAVSVS